MDSELRVYATIRFITIVVDNYIPTSAVRWNHHYLTINVNGLPFMFQYTYTTYLPMGRRLLQPTGNAFNRPNLLKSQ